MSWFTAQQCSNRWKSLKSSSQKFLDSQKESGVSRKREPLFHQRVMDLIGDKCSVEPAAVMDSGSALPSLYGPTASCASAPASPGVSEFEGDHTTGGMTSALPVAVRGATRVASSVTAKSPLPQTCDKPAAAVMEGVVSERGKLRKHDTSDASVNLLLMVSLSSLRRMKSGRRGARKSRRSVTRRR